MLPTAKFDPSKVAVYIRWSTDEQGQGTTLEVQRDACLYFIKSQGWEFSEGLVFIDEGFSGASLDRPALGQMRNLVKAGAVSCVVVYKLDRLSRNLLDCVSLVRQEWAKVPLYSTKENFDTQSPVGQMVFNMLVSFAEFERNVIRDRMMSGKAKRAEQGRNSGFKYPFGFMKGLDGSWAINEGEAATVRRMFTEYLNGAGFYDIAVRLTNDGVPTPTGKAVWKTATVQWILSNPFYAGRFVAGAWEKGEEGAYRKGAPKYQVAGALPAVVRPADFDRAQEIRKQRAGMAPRALASNYLLTGILRCQRCGGPMVGHKHSGSNKRFYKCVNVRDLRSCDCGVIPADNVEEEVLEEIRRTHSAANLARHIQRIEEHRDAQISQAQHALSAQEEALADIQRRRAKVEADYFAGDLDARSYSKFSERLDAEEAGARERLTAAQNALKEAQVASVDLERLQGLIAQMGSLDSLTDDQRKHIVREVIATVTAYRPKAQGRSLPVELTVETKVQYLRAGER